MMAMPNYTDLKLNSPAGPENEPKSYQWTGSVGMDILDTVNLIRNDTPEVNGAMKLVPEMLDIETSSYETMTELCEQFNNAIDKMLASESAAHLEQRLNKFASRNLLGHILQQVYKSAVAEPLKLNKYEPFSAHVYGETTFKQVCQIIDNLKIGPDDVFIDLGSGVGQVVLQMAATNPLKLCFGIELADVPSNYAVVMDANFRASMKWFGKKFCDYQLIKGDFLSDEHREKINMATIIFVNNFAFGPAVNEALKQRFACLPDRVQIVSTRNFCSFKYRISDRNLTDIGTILNVTELPPITGAVSWTDKPVPFYVNVIDRTRLEGYFQERNTNNGNSIKLASTNVPSRRSQSHIEKASGSETKHMRISIDLSTVASVLTALKDNSQSNKENNNNADETEDAQGNDVQQNVSHNLQQYASMRTTTLLNTSPSESNRGMKTKLDLLQKTTLSSTTNEATGLSRPPVTECPLKENGNATVPSSAMPFECADVQVTSNPVRGKKKQRKPYKYVFRWPKLTDKVVKKSTDLVMKSETGDQHPTLLNEKPTSTASSSSTAGSGHSPQHSNVSAATGTTVNACSTISPSGEHIGHQVQLEEQGAPISSTSTIQHTYGRGRRLANRISIAGSSAVSSSPDRKIPKKSLYDTFYAIVKSQSSCTEMVAIEQKSNDNLNLIPQPKRASRSTGMQLL